MCAVPELIVFPALEKMLLQAKPAYSTSCRRNQPLCAVVIDKGGLCSCMCERGAARHAAPCTLCRNTIHEKDSKKKRKRRVSPVMLSYLRKLVWTYMQRMLLYCPLGAYRSPALTHSYIMCNSPFLPPTMFFFISPPHCTQRSTEDQRNTNRFSSIKKKKGEEIERCGVILFIP